MAWHRVASIAEVNEDVPFATIVNNKPLGIYRIGDKFYALADVCPHAYALLTSGFVEGEVVECPLHQATFHIPTGKCLGPPADEDVATFEIKVEGDDILVAV
jgi:3-phenylpropionate/trans-cinnamate dioxygenase ferredoxin subunit